MMFDDIPPIPLGTDADTQALTHLLGESAEQYLPTLFISHGAPTVAIDASGTRAAWERIGEKILGAFGKPKAILIMSPHWIGRGQAVSAAHGAPILHDFHGFPKPLYALTYPSPGLPSLAEQIQTMLLVQGFACQLDAHRGLDHGAWVPMRSMFPEADIPVLQISMPFPQNPEHYVQLGRTLQVLSRQGVLIIGSGSLTHNLAEYEGQPVDAPAYPYVEAFSTWIEQQLLAQDLLALLDYRYLAPFATRAHPQDDHLMPFFFAIGAADSIQSALLHSEVNHGILSMDCFAFGSQSGKLLP